MASRIQARSTADCSSTGMNTYDQSSSTRHFMGLQPSSGQKLAVIHLDMVDIVDTSNISQSRPLEFPI